MPLPLSPLGRFSRPAVTPTIILPIRHKKWGDVIGSDDDRRWRPRNDQGATSGGHFMDTRIIWASAVAPGTFGKARGVVLALALCATTLPGSVYAQSSCTGILKLPQDIEFKGPRAEPRKRRSFMAIRRSREYSSPASSSRLGGRRWPHSHPDEISYSCGVIRTFSISPPATNGTKASSRPIRPARSIPSPQTLHICTWAKDGEVVLQITAVGPTGKKFIPQPK